MNTFLSYLVVFAIAALIVLPSLVGHARDRAVDRQLREAERPVPTTPAARPVRAAEQRQELAYERYAV
jgi:hypothetical protein